MKKEYVLKIRLSENERDLLRKLSQELGTTMTDTVIQSLLDLKKTIELTKKS